MTEPKKIAKVLKTNTSLKELNLDGNNLGPAGAKALSDALKITTSLTTLNLSFTKIRSKRATSIAEALKENKILFLG